MAESLSLDAFEAKLRGSASPAVPVPKQGTSALAPKPRNFNSSGLRIPEVPVTPLAFGNFLPPADLGGGAPMRGRPAPPPGFVDELGESARAAGINFLQTGAHLGEKYGDMFLGVVEAIGGRDAAAYANGLSDELDKIDAGDRLSPDEIKALQFTFPLFSQFWQEADFLKEYGEADPADRPGLRQKRFAEIDAAADFSLSKSYNEIYQRYAAELQELAANDVPMSEAFESIAHFKAFSARLLGSGSVQAGASIVAATNPALLATYVHSMGEGQARSSMEGADPDFTLDKVYDVPGVGKVKGRDIVGGLGVGLSAIEMFGGVERLIRRGAAGDTIAGTLIKRALKAAGVGGVTEAVEETAQGTLAEATSKFATGQDVDIGKILTDPARAEEAVFGFFPGAASSAIMGAAQRPPDQRPRVAAETPAELGAAVSALNPPQPGGAGTVEIIPKDQEQAEFLATELPPSGQAAAKVIAGDEALTPEEAEALLAEVWSEAEQKQAEIVEKAPVKTSEKPSGLVALNPLDIQTDAARFQFKSGTDAEGVSNQLQNVKKWDPAFANIAIVWQDNAGSLFMVDGHQRLALARRLLSEGHEPIELNATVLREADGITPQDARRYGALKNLAEGGESTTPLDVARVLKEGGALSEIEKVIPPARTAYRDGKALASLGDDAFGMVANELVPVQFAAEVGNVLTDPAQQLAALGYMAQNPPANRNQARLVAEQIRNAGFEEGTQEGLFGAEAFAETLMLERATVLDAAIKKLRQSKRAFKTALVNKEELESVGSKIKTEKTEKALTAQERMLATVEKLATRKGDISDALTEAAKKLKAGASRNAAAAAFIETLALRKPNQGASQDARAGETARVEATRRDARGRRLEAAPGQFTNEGAERILDEIARRSISPDYRDHLVKTGDAIEVEQTPEGTQTLAPGVKPVSPREKLEAKMRAKLKGKAAPFEGTKLGDVAGHGQLDLVDMAKKPSPTAAKEALKHAGKAVKEAIDGLTNLFGGNDPSRLGSSPTFDEETYRKALPHFQAAWAEMRAAGTSAREFAMWAFEKWGTSIRPYVARFITTKEDWDARPKGAGPATDETLREAEEFPFEPWPGGKKTPAELFEERLRRDLSHNVIEAAEEMFLELGFPRDPDARISDQIMYLITTNRLTPEMVVPILEKHGVSSEEFARLWRGDAVREAASLLGKLGSLEARIKQLTDRDLTPEERAALRKDGFETRASSLIQRLTEFADKLTDLWRGSLVVQPATAIRNLTSQVMALEAYSVMRTIDYTIARTLGHRKAEIAHPVDAYASLSRIFYNPRTTRREVDAILSAAVNARHWDSLFLRFHSDVDSRLGKHVTGFLNKAGKFVDLLNTMNRAQEFLIRRAIFAAHLDERLRRQGTSLAEVVASRAWGTVDQKDMEAAIEIALELTWGKSFDPHAQKYTLEYIASSVIRIEQAIPLSKVMFPFPRFFFNSMKYIWEYNPTGFLSVLSKGEREAMAKGDFKAIAKAMTGSMMLGAALAIRGSDWAGERWYEIVMPDFLADIIGVERGASFDMRNYNPFAQYLFVADLSRRFAIDRGMIEPKSHEGGLKHLRWSDIMGGVFGSNTRGGVSLYTMNQILEGIANDKDTFRAHEQLERAAGEYIAGYITFLGPFSDLAASFDDAEATIRDRDADPFWGPMYARIPGMGNEMPAVEMATREEDLMKLAPWLRQLTGLTVRHAKNAVEKELDRMGFRRAEYAPRMGSPEADRLVNKYMGRYMAGAIALVTSPAYLTSDDAHRAFVLDGALAEIRKGALGAAQAENPALFERLKYNRMPTHTRLLLQSKLPPQTLDALKGSELNRHAN